MMDFSLIAGFEWGLAEVLLGILISVMATGATFAYSTWRTVREVERLLKGEESVEGWDGLIGEYQMMKRWKEEYAEERLEEHEERISEIERKLY